MPMILRTGNKAAGFTLVEVTIAIFITLVLMALAVPSFVRSYNGALLGEMTRTFATTCQWARIQAVSKQRPAIVHVDVTSQKFWLTQAGRDDGADALPLKVVEMSARVALVRAERLDDKGGEPGGIEINFYPNGTCDAATVSFRGTERGSGLAVTLDPITARGTVAPVKL